MKSAPKAEKVLKLARAGVPLKSIAVQAGCSVSLVYSVVRKARRRGETIGECWGPQSRTLEIQPETFRLLANEAEIRGRSVATLCTYLLRRIAADQLACAILDDGFETPPLPTEEENQ